MGIWIPNMFVSWMNSLKMKNGDQTKSYWRRLGWLDVDKFNFKVLASLVLFILVTLWKILGRGQKSQAWCLCKRHTWKLFLISSNQYLGLACCQFESHWVWIHKVNGTILLHVDIKIIWAILLWVHVCWVFLFFGGFGLDFP